MTWGDYYHDIRRQLTRTVAPTELPITLPEVKTQLRLGDMTDWDGKIEDEWIPEAVDIIERDTLRALMPQTWQLVMDKFPCGEIQLRRCPVAAVTSITYLDSDGDSTVLAADEYYTDLVMEPAIILPVTSWPSTDWDRPNSVTVLFTAGYATQAAVPPVAKQLIKLLVEGNFAGCSNHEAYDRLIGRLLWGGLVYA